MMNVRRTEAEAANLRAIWTRDLLDSHPELECEELVQLAAAICGTPIGLVTLLDERHQWYRASEHLKMGETPTRGGLLRAFNPGDRDCFW